MPDWLSKVELGSPAHLLSAGWSLALPLVFALAMRRRVGTAVERRARRAWVLAMVAVQAAVLWYAFQPERYDPFWSWPLQLCDFAAFVAIVGLWSGWRVFRTLTYFWGLGLSTQALLTPVEFAGPDKPEYWFFWIAHAQIVGSALYELVALGYRPAVGDLRVVVLATLAYAALVVPIDLAFDLNYGFVGPDSAYEPGTVLDAFPRYPWRVVVLLIVVVSWFAVLWAIWRPWRGTR